MRPIITISLLAVSLLAHAETYRWVDPATGGTVISDTPPPRSVKDVSKAKDSGSNPEGQSYAALKAAENFPVTLYTAASCIAECKAARDLLNGRGVPFTEKMIQTDEDQEALKKLVGDAAVPSVKVGRQSMRGFEANAFNNLLDLAGSPNTPTPGSKPAGGLQPPGKAE